MGVQERMTNVLTDPTTFWFCGKPRKCFAIVLTRSLGACSSVTTVWVKFLTQKNFNWKLHTSSVGWDWKTKYFWSAHWIFDISNCKKNAFPIDLSRLLTSNFYASTSLFFSTRSASGTSEWYGRERKKNQTLWMIHQNPDCWYFFKMCPKTVFDSIFERINFRNCSMKLYFLRKKIQLETSRL